MCGASSDRVCLQVDALQNVNLARAWPTGTAHPKRSMAATTLFAALAAAAVTSATLSAASIGLHGGSGLHTP